MFDELVAKQRRKSGRATVVLAAVLHAGAVALAIWWTQVPPPDGAIDTVFPGPLRAPPRAGPEKGPSAPDKPKGRPPRPERKPPKLRKPTLSHEPVEPTITIADVPAAPAEPEVAPQIDEPVGEGRDEPGAVGGGGGGPVDGPGGPGTIGDTLGPTGPRGEEKVELLGEGLTRPLPAAGCRPPAPLMPSAARLGGITGRVLVQFVVHGDGHVGEVRSLDPRSPQILVEAVRAWIEGCPFQPALRGGRPVSVKMSQPFNFRLQ